MLICLTFFQSVLYESKLILFFPKRAGSVRIVQIFLDMPTINGYKSNIICGLPSPSLSFLQLIFIITN